MNQSVETFLVALDTRVDDWVQHNAAAMAAGRAGAKPVFSDSEVITLALAQHWLGFASERGFVRFVGDNYRHLFPKLLFTRRVRNLCWWTNRLRRDLVAGAGWHLSEYRLVDTTPVVVRHWRRHGVGHLRLPDAALGYCAAKRETFYGYRLVAVTTLDGVITDWGLVPANGDEREGALDVLWDYAGLVCLGDKGFLDAVRQGILSEERGTLLITPKRRNQGEQNPEGFDALFGDFRRRIETTFAQAKEQLGLERPRARSLWGVLSRLIAKITAHTLAAVVNREHGRAPLEMANFAF
jgi:hypothetical protein